MIDSSSLFIANKSVNNFEFLAADTIVNKHQITEGVFSRTAYEQFKPELIVENAGNNIGLVLMVLLLIISAVWFFSPDLIRNNFKSIIDNPFKRNWESTVNTSGFIVNILLYINFLIVFSILIFVLINNGFNGYSYFDLDLKSFFYILILVAILVIFRFLYIGISGFIFMTFEMSKHQNNLYNSLDKALGLVSIPLLLVYLYGNEKFFTYASLLVIAIIFFARWFFTMAIGIRITKFSWFHIILYLCTLEIIPFLLLWKMLENGHFTLI